MLSQSALARGQAFVFSGGSCTAVELWSYSGENRRPDSRSSDMSPDIIDQIIGDIRCSTCSVSRG
jgi:hypothetical protein